MRISDARRALGLGLVLVALGAAPVLALDGKPKPATPQTPLEAFRSGTQAYLAGEKAKALTELQYAAEQGHGGALWKLGRMYADGDGVKQDDRKAFEYFSRLASDYAEEQPTTAQARFVSNAFVALGGYYLHGIPNSDVKPDVARAHRLYAYAASYFGDSDAQYQLARLYLDGALATKDPRQAARWFHAAAQKGHYQAQAMLGHMLFRGEQLPRQGARGLMWLTLARESAAGPEDDWIVEYYEEAMNQASDDERALARIYIKEWLRSRR
jgi:TPR repeat protein